MTADLRSDLVRLVHSGNGVREFSLRAARIVSRSVGFDGVAVLTMDPATSLVTRAFVQNGLPADAAPRLIEIEHREGDVNTFAALARSGQLAASLELETHGQLNRSLRHRELRAPVGLGDELRTVLVSDAGTWGGLTLGRAADSRPFSADEVALMASVSRHLAEGLKRATLLTALTTGAERSAGFALLTAGNAVASADATAEAWLQELGTDAPVIAAVASQARRIAAGRDTTGALARARIQTPSGAWVTVRASVLDGGQTALTIEPIRPNELTPLIADAYGLTPRERSVVRLVAQGLPTECVAQRLHVTTWTVQDHLKSVFEKVGVCSRGELTARIFFTHHPPRLTDS
jgi:DNA-binding CsgD family transcriptional regulator